MAHVQGQDAVAVYTAVNRWVERSLRADLGLFTDYPAWSREVLVDLSGLVAAHYEDKANSFNEAWHRLLAGSRDEVLELAAELLWLYLLFPARVGQKRKRALVQTTLSWMVEPPALPADLDAALATGLAPTGPAYHARRKAHVRFLLEAVIDLKSRSVAKRETLLTDPWRAKAWVEGLEHDNAHTARTVLLHLLHPGTFEPIVSGAMKRRIAETFAQHVPGYVEDIDDALLHVRGALEPELGRGFSFTDEVVRELWRPAQASQPTPASRREVRRAQRPQPGQ